MPTREHCSAKSFASMKMLFLSIIGGYTLEMQIFIQLNNELQLGRADHDAPPALGRPVVEFQARQGDPVSKYRGYLFN